MQMELNLHYSALILTKLSGWSCRWLLVAARNFTCTRVMPTNYKLALISFVSLFLELVVIRWLASEVRIFASFKNLPLFAAFLGLGAGFLIAPSRRNYFRHTPLFLLASVLVIGLAPRFGYTHIIFADPYEYYLLGGWKNPSAFTMVGGLGLLAGVFALIVFLFVGSGEKVGEYLELREPTFSLQHQRCGGSCRSTGLHHLSYMRTGPAVWVLVAILPLIPFFWRSRNILVLAAIAIVVPFMPKANAWSPYYRIDLEQISAEAKNGEMLHQGYTVNVNHDGILGAYDLRERLRKSFDRQAEVRFDRLLQCRLQDLWEALSEGTRSWGGSRK